jgi:hypothetical protein
MGTNKVCQSCGMPLNKDPEKGGTNQDGTKTMMYCSYCYQDGSFTRPDMTAREMKALVQGKLKEMRFPGFLAGLMTRRIPKLERWVNK